MNTAKQPSGLERIEFGVLMAAVFFAPFSSFRHPSLFITVSDVLFLLALLLRVRLSISLLPMGAGTFPWFLGVILLAHGLLLSSLINGDPIRGLIVFSQYIFAYVWLPFALLNRPYDQTMRLIKCAAWSMFAMCAFGIIAYYSGYKGGYTRHFMIVSGGGRLTSLVDNPNGLAGLIALNMPLLWFLALVRAVRTEITIIFVAALLVALILTSSNTGLAALAIAVLVFLGGLARIKTIVIAAVSVGTIGAAIALWGDYILPATFKKRVMGAIMSGDVSEAGTFMDRYSLMEEALRLAEDNIFIGMGADQYRIASEHNLPVHNTYLLLLNEGGLIAVMGFIVVLGGAIVAALAARNRPHGHVVLVSTVTIVATLAGLSMAYAHMYARFLILPVLLIIGPAVSSTLIHGRQPRSVAPSEPAGRREGETAY